MPSAQASAAPPLRLTAPEVKRRVGRTALALFVLLVAWPAIGYVYRPVYRALAPGAVNLFGTKIQTSARASTSDDLAQDTARMDTVILVKHKDFISGHGKLPTSTFHHAYLPTAVLLALVWGGTRGGWREKKRGLLYSLLLLHAFLALRVGTAVIGLLNVSKINGKPVLDLGETGAWLVEKLKSFLWDEPVLALVVPVILWALFAFERPRETAL